MAFVFTLLFIATAYITPQVLLGPLVELRLEVVLALLAIVTSLPNIARSRLGQSPQMYAFLAFCVAVPVSILAGGWLAGAADAIYGLMPLVLRYVLPAANFRSLRQMQWMILAMVCCSAYFIYMGLSDLHNNVNPSDFLYGTGELRRLRGLGFVYDPNDLAQVLVSLLPMVFLWKSRNRFLNLFLVGVPVALLVTGMFFTHSRGSALALMAVVIIALRRKIGTVPAAVLAGALFAASLAVGWSGGREVSVEAGGDRLDAWSTGLEFIKHHPVFGVGAGRFSDFNEITAHNSVVVCAAELGLPGFVCWVFMIFSALRAATGIKRPVEDSEENAVPGLSPVPRLIPPSRLMPAPAGHLRPAVHLQTLRARFAPVKPVLPHMRRAAPATPFSGSSFIGAGQRGPMQPTVTPEQQQENVLLMARLLVCSLTGFLVAGWFLSRALSMWLFFYFGAVYAVVEMAREAGLETRHDTFPFLLRWSMMIAIGLLLAVYAVLKFRALTGR